jgi:hypothetical protein
MKTRRDFLAYLAALTTALFAAVVTGCGARPDAETEPSPEWPPKE